MHDSFEALLPMIIPEGVSDYFALSDNKKDTSEIHIYLEELNSIPSECQQSPSVGPGFFSELVSNTGRVSMLKNIHYIIIEGYFQ